MKVGLDLQSIWGALAYLLVLSIELILYMLAAIYAGRSLNNSYPSSFDWVTITLALSLLLCVYSLYRFFVKIIKIPPKKT